MRFTAYSCGIALMSAPLWLLAQPSNDSPEAARLRQAIDGVIAHSLKGIPPDQVRADYDKAFPIVVEGDQLVATIPQDRLIFSDNTAFVSGPTVIRSPITAPNPLPMDWSVGGPWLLVEDDETVATLTLDQAQFNLLWDTEAAALQQITMILSNGVLTTPDTAEDAFAATLGQFQLDYQTTVDGAQNWATTSRAALENLVMAAGNSRIEIGRLAGGSDSQGQQYDQFMALYERLQAQNALFAAADDEAEAVIAEPVEQTEAAPVAPEGEADPAVAAAEAQADLEAQAAALKATLDNAMAMMGLLTKVGYDLEVSAFNLYEGSELQFGLGQLNHSMALEKDAQSRLALGYRLGLSQMSLASQLPIESPELLPNEVRFNIALSGVPLEVLQNVGELGLAAEAMDSEMMGMMALMTLAPALLQNGTRFAVRDTAVGFPAGRFDFDGFVTAEPQAVYQTVAQFTVKATNLDKLVNLSGMSGDPDIAKGLVMLRLFAQTTVENGQTVDYYRFELTPEGKMLLNGKDMSPLFESQP